jgi:hypothetical protein
MAHGRIIVVRLLLGISLGVAFATLATYNLQDAIDPFACPLVDQTRHITLLDLVHIKKVLENFHNELST